MRPIVTERRSRRGTRRVARARAAWRVRAGLLAATGVLALLITLVGVHPSSTSDLERAVADGDVASVVVHAEELPAEVGSTASGSGRTEVRWRDGVVRRSSWITTVLPGTPPGERSEARADADGPVVVGDVAEHLRALAPDLRVDRAPPVTSRWSLWDVAVPGWLLLAAAATWLAGLAVVVQGPEPWRMTRWAWAWSLLLLPWGLGVVAFSLLAGATPRLPRGRGLRRRWGGLKGFVLAFVVSGLLPGR